MPKLHCYEGEIMKKIHIGKLMSAIGLVSALVGSHAAVIQAAESTVKRESPQNSTAAPTEQSGGVIKRIDINTASKTELATLPGIGPATAAAIIAARPFTRLEQLKDVPGIGEAKFASLRSHVKVSRANASTQTQTDDKAQGVATSGYPVGSEAGASPNGPLPKTSEERRAAPHSSSSDVKDQKDRKFNKSVGGRIDINHATQAELESLPGIGPVKAQAIIEGRPYKNPEDLMNVKGIKQGTFNKIKDQITVR